MHINSALSTYFWDTKVRTFLLLDFQVFKPVFYCFRSLPAVVR